MKTVVASLILLSAMSAAHANDRALDEIKRGVANAVERYAQSMSCTGVKVGPQDVMELAPNESGDEASKFVVVWTDSTGCTGAPGTHIVMASANNDDYLVDSSQSTRVEEFDGDDATFVQRVVNHSANSLTLEGKAYGPYDSNKPSIPVRFTLRMDEKGHWKMADKIKLPFAL